MITVFDDETSAASYTIRVLLGVLGQDFTAQAIETYPNRHPDEPAVAVVVVDERCHPPAVLTDHWAAMLYLSHSIDSKLVLLPDGAGAARAETLDWFAFARRLADSAGTARRHESFGEPLIPTDARERAHKLLEVMDRHLWFGEADSRWFLAGDFSLADVACFADVALSEEGDISRQDYPAVRRWLDRVKRTPGVPSLSGIFPAAPEAC